MSLSRRNSLSCSPQLSASTQDLKQRVITCLNKLSDRDTLALASSELQSIAKTLTHNSFSPFLNCIHNTDSSTKPPVRKQCVNLITLLSNSHGDALSPFVSKMISTVVRRLRDPDSAVRSACIDAVTAMSSQITKPSFSVSFLKPLLETLIIEQDLNSQIGSALCLAAAIEASPDPEVAELKKSLPRLGKLAKSEGFKAKAALLILIGSIVGVGGASSRSVLDWLVPSVVEFLSCEDWGVRKAAAEALGRVTMVERDLATLYKDPCLNALESRRFDKVKIVRETMNHTLELWKELAADASEVISAPSPSRSSLDNSRKSSHETGFKTPQPKKTVPTNRSPPSVSLLLTTASKGSSLKSNDKDSSKSTICKLDYNKKPCEWKIEIAVPGSASSNVTPEDKFEKTDYNVSKSNKMDQTANCMMETKHGHFSKSREDKVNKFSAFRARSCVVPFKENEKDALVSNAPEKEAYENEKDVEDISLIREQLLQIENQQSNLFDLLQRFMGNSQTGLNSLETRVRGLEMALGEISYDLALSSGRIPNNDIAENTCCKLPGAEFLSSKFWRRTEGRYSTPRFSASGVESLFNAPHHQPDRDAGVELYKSDNHRFHSQNGGHSYRTLGNAMKDSDRLQVCSAIGHDRTSPVAPVAPVHLSTGSSV